MPDADAVADTDAGALDGGVDGVDGPPLRCTLSAAYTLKVIPSNLNPSFFLVTTLTAPAQFGYERHSSSTPDGSAPPSCSVALPTCGDPALLDVSDIEADLADPEVQAALALATPPSYGDSGGDAGGSALRRADGHGFTFYSSSCVLSSSVCPPAGVLRLVLDLAALQTQELVDPACAAVR